MKTLLVATAGALLLAASAGSASAQPYNGGWGYNRGPGSYADYVRQVRACQRHARLHAELGAEHAEEHHEGFDSRGDHRDLHDALGEAHEAYHEDHPRADFCDRFMRQNRYAPAYGSAPAYRYGYPSGAYGYDYRPGYQNGWSLGFSYGR
jgi:hypothetical protein